MESKNEEGIDIEDYYHFEDFTEDKSVELSTANPVIYPNFMVNIITKVSGKRYTESEAEELLESIKAEYPGVDEEQIKKILKVFNSSIVFDKEN